MKSFAQYQLMKLGAVIKLEYGKPLSDHERPKDGLYPVYGSNGEKTRTNKYYYDQKSIIVGRKGSAGELNLTEEKFWPLDVTYFVKFDHNKHDLYFIYYLLKTLHLPSLAKGVKPGINRNDVYSLLVLIPPLNEQKRIVTILDKVFAVIDKAKENIERNLKNSNEFFEVALQNTFRDVSAQGEKKTLKEVSLDFGRGKSRHRPRNDKKLYNGKYPFIQTGDIRNCNHYLENYTQTYNEIGLAQSKLWPKGTICITIAANIAETGVLNFSACFPDSVIGLVVNDKIADANYIEFLLQSFRSYLKSKGKGSAQDNINLATFENERFPIPSLSVQKDIISRLEMHSFLLKKYESICQRKMILIKELSASILQKTISGELTKEEVSA